MKDFSGLILCNYRSERVDIHVTADLSHGSLTFSGQDLGPFVREVWGDSDYEYWYSFSAEETAKLASVIDGETNLESALLREFSGKDGCRMLRKVCAEHGIQYRFTSYA